MLLLLAVVLLLAAAAPADTGAPILDDFNRPNEAPISQGGNWASTSVSGGTNTLQVLNGVAMSFSGNGSDRYQYRTSDYSGDVSAYAMGLKSSGNSDIIGLLIDLQGVGSSSWSGYVARVIEEQTSTDHFRIYKVTNGSFSQLASADQPFASGDRIGIRRVGSDLEFWESTPGLAWTKIVTATDSTYTSGKIGIEVQNVTTSNSALDDFGGGPGTFPPPPPPTPDASPVLDDFNRPDENPVSQNGQWASTGLTGGVPLKLQNNQLVTSNDGSAYRVADYSGDMQAFFTVATVPTNLNAQYVDIDLGNVPSSSWRGYSFVLAANGTGSTYFVLRRVDNGSATDLGTIYTPVSAGDKILLRKTGNTLEGWLFHGGAWNLVLTRQDGAYSDGKIGVAIYNAGFGNGGGAIDDFGGGTLAPPPGPPPPERCYGSLGGRGSFGMCTGHAYADPVNTLTGAFVTQVDDLSTPGTGVSFDWQRSYTSDDPTVGSLGPGWTDTYAASLTIAGNGDVTARGPDGQEMAYTKQPDGSFVGSPDARATLSSAQGGYQLVLQDQTVYSFDAQGTLTSITDRNGQGVTLAYDGQGRLSSVTDAAGRQVSVAYNASSLVSSVTTQDGRSISYGYTGGLLTSVTDVRGKTWTYGYDAGGRLTTITDPLNHPQVTNVYGPDGRVQSQQDALGKQTRFAWDAGTETATVTDPDQHAWKDIYSQSLLLKEIDPAGDTTQFGHDANLNANTVTSPKGETTSLTYDAAGNLTKATAPSSLNSVHKDVVYNARNDPTQVTDARGKVTSYTYTPQGNVETVTQDGTQVASYSYYPDGTVHTFSDGRGKQTTYTYDANGNLASVTDPAGDETTYTYWPDGNVKTRVDPKGNCSGCTPSDYTTTYTYNAAGQLLTETDPLGHVTQTNVYDDAGRLQSATDANNHTTDYAYDDANRLLSETGPSPDGTAPRPVTSFSYDDAGNKLTETDPNGNTTHYAYNQNNQLVSTTQPSPGGGQPAPVTSYTYDQNGNLASTVDPRGNVSGANPDDYRTTYTYDAAGRLKTTSDPLGHQTTNVYDAVGNLQSVTDANTHLTSYTYDAAGRILTVTAPDQGLTTYTYFPDGSLHTRTDDNGHQTTYTYDDAGRISSVTGPTPSGGTAPVTSYSYDPNGNELTLTDPNRNANPNQGGVTTYGYDRANRLTSIAYSDSTPAVSYTYDSVGNRLTMSDGSGTETRTYDNLDRLLTAARGSNTFSYRYDAGGNVTRRTYPDGTQVDYTYDPLERLASVTSGGQTTSYAYDVASNLTQTTLPSGNGYVQSRSYDRAGRLTDVASAKAGTTLAEFAITPDPVGNPTQIVRTGSLSQTQTYTYDASDRLTGVCFQAGTCPNTSDPFIRWTYDKVGNRLSEARPGASTVNYSYDALDRLTSAGPTSYTYDQNGNELSAGSRTFAYDLANRLKTTTSGSTTTTYTYDGDGNRLQASTGTQASKKTNYLWDVNQGLPQIGLERDGSSALLRRYLYGLRRISMTEGGATSYYMYDGLGSVANLTSATGATQWTWSYEPFGSIHTEQKANGNQPDNFMKFAGEYLDPTGLYFLRARQYDPGSGRFLQVDPLEGDRHMPHGNRYVYASNRPTVLADPSGETATPTGAAEEVAALATSRCIDAPSVDDLVAYRAPQQGIPPFKPMPVCRNWRFTGKAGTLTIDYRGNGYIAWGFSLNQRTRRLYAGLVFAYGLIGRNSAVVGGYSKPGVPPDYPFHASHDGYKYGDVADVLLEFNGRGAAPNVVNIRVDIDGACRIP